MTHKWNMELLQAYLEYGRSRIEDGRFSEQHEWAYDQVLDLFLSADAPELLSLVMALVSSAPLELMNWVAAGPVEDLLAKFGPRVIDALLAAAKSDPQMRHALRGVWGELRIDAET